MKRKGEFIFEVLILGVIIGFVLYGLSYSPTARLVPLVVGIPGLIFAVLQLIGSLPGVSKRLEKLSSTKDLFGTKGIKPKEEEAQEPEEEVEETSTPAWIVFVWIVGFTALIILFGYSGASWLYSILSAVGIEVVMYGGFVLLLNVFLYEGLVFNLIAGR
ncbi:MAG: hypothetical protein ACE5NJ_04255 [Thermodesulfobacteriota bacterium]